MIDKKISLMVYNKTELLITKLSVGGVLGPCENIIFCTSFLDTPCYKVRMPCFLSNMQSKIGRISLEKTLGLSRTKDV